MLCLQHRSLSFLYLFIVQDCWRLFGHNLDHPPLALLGKPVAICISLGSPPRLYVLLDK